MKEMITVEKEVYEAVLRNSVRVNDLEAENQRLKELLKECKTSIDVLIKMNIDGINGYSLLYLLFKIDKAIGENKCMK